MFSKTVNQLLNNLEWLVKIRKKENKNFKTDNECKQKSTAFYAPSLYYETLPGFRDRFKILERKI